jgi:tRNA threonylcarbamoyl adenosine modification protein YeaZ
MKILALEFSSRQSSVAVPSRSGVKEVTETGHGASRALGMVEEVLRQAELDREEIECLAVGIGPGSYNGIRAAIALAQGWQLARGVKLLGISSAECMAAQAQADGLTGKLSVVIDAQRGEFYLAGYESGSKGHREIEPLRIVSKAGVSAREQAGELLIGPEITRWFASGKIISPRAAVLGKLALDRNDFVTGEKLEPIYLRETKFVKAPPPRIFPESGATPSLI